jgi:hypothetical protein
MAAKIKTFLIHCLGRMVLSNPLACDTRSSEHPR